MRSRLIGFSLAVMAVMALPITAQAETIVKLAFQNVNKGIGTTINDSTDGIVNKGTTAGQYKLHINDVAGAPANITLLSYCIDVVDNADSNYRTYKTKSLDLAPITKDGGDQMGAAKANLIKQLWGAVKQNIYDPSSPDAAWTAQRAAAFGLAVWEIVWEDGLSLNLTTPDFTSSDTDGARALANTWLSNITGAGIWNTAAYQVGGQYFQSSLLALTSADGPGGSTDYQDFILVDGTLVGEEVPVPGALVQMIGLACVVGLVGYRRRRQG